MNNKYALAYNGATGDFAVVSPELAQAMMTTGNTQNLNRVSLTLKPKRLVLRWIKSGETAVEIELIGMTLRHICGRVEAKKIISRLIEWTGAPAFNVKNSGNLTPLTH